METAEAQRIVDDEHLRLLGIGHYITGGLSIAFASLFIFHFVFILLAASNPEIFSGPQGRHGMPDGVMQVFAAFVGLFILGGWAFGALTIYAGRCLKRRRRWTLSLVVACLNTLFIPVGTILGVFTLIVLNRPSVKAQYK